MDADDVAIGDVARGNVGTDAAAVDEGHIGAQHRTVSVGAQVTQVGLSAADGTLAVGAVDGQLHLGLGDDLVLQGVELLSHGGDVSGGISVGSHIGQVDILAGDGAVSLNGDLAHVGQLGAGLGESHVVAGLILHSLGEGGVGVAVDESVKAGGVGDDLLGGPGGGLSVDAQVTQADDVICAGGFRRVDGLLGRSIQLLAVAALTETVDIIAVCVLEIGGRGLCEGLGGAQAHESDLLAIHLEQLIGVEHGLASLIHKVGGDIRVLGLFPSQLQELIHIVVELMVAGDSHIVADLVHNVHDVLALGQRADHAALDGVTGVHQQVGVLRQGRNLVVGLIIAVDVIGMENDDLIRGCGRDHQRLLCAGGDSQGEHHGQNQQQRQKFLASHGSTSFCFGRHVPDKLIIPYLPSMNRAENAKFCSCVL